MKAEEAARARTSSRLWRAAGILASVGLLCALLLAGLSAWFLGSVAIAGLSAAAYTFNYHVPGALVRLFAIGRTAARYGERLLGHQAALTDQTHHRVALFNAMAAAPAVRIAGWQLADQARLAVYLDDVEDIDFARLRSGLPGRLLLAGMAGASLATLFVAPLALVPVAVLLALSSTLAWGFARRGARLLLEIRKTDRDGAAAFGAILESAVPLQGEGRWAPLCDDALRSFSRADVLMKELRQAQAGLDGLASLLGPVAATSVFSASLLGGDRGQDLLIPMFLAFSWLALGEPIQGLSRIVVAAMRAQAAQFELARWTDRSASTAASENGPTQLSSLRSASLQRRAPDGRSLKQAIFLDLKAGRPTILIGASGAGKTSLLKQIAGWIGDDILQCDDGALSASARRSLAMLCPHDAAILADTVRANLFAPSADDADFWAALEAMELADRVRQSGGLDGWIAQDMVSLGEAQRFNLARAWLSTKPLILLDEPTEHLDAAQAERLVARLLERVRQKLVVISSHRPIKAEGCDQLHLD